MSPRLRLAALALAVGVAFADSSIVVLALPDLLGELGVSIPAVAWVVTAYNVAVAVVAAALALIRTLPSARLALVGVVLFAASSAACAAAGDLAVLVAARAAQGVGAALLLAGALPLMRALSPRGARLWGAAAVVGATVGPALGGALTEGFDWRAIFVVQVPLAAAALPAVLGAPAGAASLRAEGGRPAGWAASQIALALVSGALVGALFLAVVLMIDGWGIAPLAAAGVVSALPLATLAVGPLAGRMGGRAALGVGAVALAGGLAAMALLPEASPLLLAGALVLAGVGLGLSLPGLTAVSLGDRGAADVAWSVGARHAGLVLGLVLVTPLLAHDLTAVGDRARDAGTERLLLAPLGLEAKVALGRELERSLGDAAPGDVPDVGAAFDRVDAGDADAAELGRLRDGLVALVETAVTRGFRNAFAVCALLALLALAPIAAVRRGRMA